MSKVPMSKDVASGHSSGVPCGQRRRWPRIPRFDLWPLPAADHPAGRNPTSKQLMTSIKQVELLAIELIELDWSMG